MQVSCFPFCVVFDVVSPFALFLMYSMQISCFAFCVVSDEKYADKLFRLLHCLQSVVCRYCFAFFVHFLVYRTQITRFAICNFSLLECSVCRRYFVFCILFAVLNADNLLCLLHCLGCTVSRYVPPLFVTLVLMYCTQRLVLFLAMV